MYEIFGLKLNVGYYVALFVVCQFVNVALNTAKTIIMHKEEKISSSIINAITYGFYAIIVVMTASALPLWITIIITAITNLIGVYGSMWLLDKLKKDSLWEIVATVNMDESIYTPSMLEQDLTEKEIAYNIIETKKQGEYVFHIYSSKKEETACVKQMLINANAKYIVHEEKVRL